jgi:hypothetical protein
MATAENQAITGIANMTQDLNDTIIGLMNDMSDNMEINGWQVHADGSWDRDGEIWARPNSEGDYSYNLAGIELQVSEDGIADPIDPSSIAFMIPMSTGLNNVSMMVANNSDLVVKQAGIKKAVAQKVGQL